jgi:hypothetical protein
LRNSPTRRWPATRAGEFGALDADGGPGVVLSERFGLSIAEISRLARTETQMRTAIKSAAGLTLKTAPGAGAAQGRGLAAFNIAPGRWLVSGDNTGYCRKRWPMPLEKTAP